MPVASDLSDLSERVRFVLDGSNDARLRAIAARASELARNLTVASEAQRLRGVLSRALERQRARRVERTRAAAAAAEEGGLEGAAQRLQAGLADALSTRPELRRAVADAIACEAGWDLGDGPQD